MPSANDRIGPADYMTADILNACNCSASAAYHGKRISCNICKIMINIRLDMSTCTVHMGLGIGHWTLLTV